MSVARTGRAMTGKIPLSLGLSLGEPPRCRLAKPRQGAPAVATPLSRHMPNHNKTAQPVRINGASSHII